MFDYQSREGLVVPYFDIETKDVLFWAPIATETLQGITYPLVFVLL